MKVTPLSKTKLTRAEAVKVVADDIAEKLAKPIVSALSNAIQMGMKQLDTQVSSELTSAN